MRYGDAGPQITKPAMVKALTMLKELLKRKKKQPERTCPASVHFIASKPLPAHAVR